MPGPMYLIVNNLKRNSGGIVIFNEGAGCPRATFLSHSLLWLPAGNSVALWQMDLSERANQKLFKSAMRQRPESDMPRGCRTAHREHQIMIAEMLIGVKKNLSKLSARFVVCLAFRLRCDISFEASFGLLSDLVLRPRLFLGVLVPRREELTAVTPAV